VLKKWDRHLANTLESREFWLMAEPVPVFNMSGSRRNPFDRLENVVQNRGIDHVRHADRQGLIRRLVNLNEGLGQQ
jgi:hypothetical protein